MIYIENTSTDPFYNQAFEEYIFDHYTEGGILLLWRNRPAVVCGCSQNIFAEVDTLQAKALGVALIRRISGGGTVYHDLGNVNYTMIRDRAGMEPQYEVFLDPVIRALRRIGAPVSRNRVSDIVIDGRKISGSAQKGTMKRIMHHGTLLYDCDLQALSALANGQRQHFETKGTASVPWPVTNLREHMTDRSMDTDDFAKALLDSFGEEHPLEHHELSEREQEEIRELADRKYRSWEWTFGRSPSFRYRRSFCIDGVQMSVDYSAKRGIIEKIGFAPERGELEKALIGARLEPEELRERIAGLTDAEDLYRYLF